MITKTQKRALTLLNLPNVTVTSRGDRFQNYGWIGRDIHPKMFEAFRDNGWIEVIASSRVHWQITDAGKAALDS